MGNVRRTSFLTGLAAVLFLLTVIPLMVHAAVPRYISFQGKVMEDGTAVSSSRTMAFSLWDNDTGGEYASGLWYEIQTVEVVDGIYNVELGLMTPLPANLHTNDDLFLQLDILHPTAGAQRLSPLMPLNSTMFALKAANADKAVDSDTLDGMDSADLDQSAHVSDTGNPHGVTAAQAGAATAAELSTHAANASAHHARYADGEAMSAVLAADGPGSGLDADMLDGQDSTAFGPASQVATNQSDIAALQATVSALQAQVAALQGLLQHFSRSGNELYISGANLNIRSGSGTTNGTVNGLGNLIVGYNENSFAATRTGSHNLVVGMQHEYTSYAGLVVGYRNAVTGPYSSISGGHTNTASGNYSSVSGGRNNTASGQTTSVSGGAYNTASGSHSSVSGGTYNTASGSNASVSGGSSNNANGSNSSVSGGTLNDANDVHATVSGGYNNTASADWATVSGGANRTAGGNSDWVGGSLWENH